MDRIPFDVDRIVNRYGARRDALVQILLDVQEELRWLPGPALSRVAGRLGVPLPEIYHVATFYRHFSLHPRGRHHVCVCMGTACHVRGAQQLLDRVVGVTGARPGGTSPDGKFSVSTVNCLGCCALGPVMTLDGEYVSDPDGDELRRLAEACD